MTSTPDNAATTWRSLTDQLTPSRVDKLAEAEKRSPLPDAEKAAALLDWAAQRNLDDHLMFSHISRPAVATAVYHCGERTDGRGWSREFVGTVRAVAGVTVSVVGTQFADGTVERTLNVYVDDLPEGSGGVLDTDRARRLAGLLIEAADELDRLGTSS